MLAPLPPVLPDRLPDYLPGRIRSVPDHAWHVPAELDDPVVASPIPRYAIDLRCLDVPIDAERVRWLVERATVRPIETRHVHLVSHGTGLHVVDGHHALAAHLAVGSDRVPVKLVRPRVPQPV